MRTRRWIIVYAEQTGPSSYKFGDCIVDARRFLWRPQFDWDSWRQCYPERVVLNMIEVT